MTASKRKPKESKKRDTSGARNSRDGQLQPGKSGGKSRFPVVGIGASAGGLEALTALLRTLPSDLEMAYVFVTHLDPSHESAIIQILPRSTSIPIVQAVDAMQVEPGRIYVIPPNRDLTIRDSRLHLEQRHEPRSINTAIDIFFRSLAADQGSNAIGIILSGTGSDGTQGLTAIKGEGGITFAQDTASAKYDGMPASAIASECVDFVLSPPAIAAELARMRQHPYLARPLIEETDEDARESDLHMARIFRMLQRSFNVDFSDYKPPTIGRRIQRRMNLHRVEKLGDYVTLLIRERNELHALYQDLLINVTGFFRNPEAFDTLKRLVYPAILKARGTSTAPIRIWVPGCSTGEEAYSHAISLVEYLGDRHSDVPIQIFGTDLSEIAIQRARAGVYKESIETDVGASRLQRFFHDSDGGYQISKAIRNLCIFSTQNVFSDAPFSRIDLVSCRNVMIYLGQALQRRVVPIFHYALNPTGFLMIGNTEGLLGSGSELFDVTDKKHKIYRKKLVSTPVSFRMSVGPDHAVEEPETLVSPAITPETPRTPVELQREADRLLLARYTPPSVVVNDNLEILQSRGRTGIFLELPTGKASLNLLKMARSGLQFELQAALDEVRQTGVEAERHNVPFDGGGSTRQATIRFMPVKTPVHDQQNFLIVFELQDGQSAPVPATEQVVTPAEKVEPSEQEKQLQVLKQELAATREYLQSIIETQEATNEELQSANEEIQSGNEELQSTNEELQTSKEELESANEELHTVNEEMQHRNELLSQLNNDLTNLLNSVNIAIVMVGLDLSLRRFTSQATEIFGLVPGDVGRPIPRLKLKIDSSILEKMMLNVIRDVQAKQFKVQDREGKWCNLRITPYRTLDNRIDGAVLSVLDRTAFDDISGNGSRKDGGKLPVRKRPSTARAK